MAPFTIDERNAGVDPAHFDALGHMPPFPCRMPPVFQAQSAYFARRECPRETGKRTGSTPPQTAAASVDLRWTWCRLTATLGPRVAPWKTFAEHSGTLGIHSVALEPTSEQPMASLPALSGLASLPWLTTRSWRAMVAGDLPDRTTAEWLHHARREMASAAPRLNECEERSTPGISPHRRIPSTDIPCRVGM